MSSEIVGIGPEIVERELSPEEVELRKFVVDCVVSCSVAAANENIQASLGEWGADFFNQMLVRVAATQSWYDGDINLEAMKNLALEKAIEIDEGRDENHPTVYRKNAKGERVCVNIESEIRKTWAGLTAELAMNDVLCELMSNGEIYMATGEESIEELEEYDRVGKVDFVFFVAGEGNTFVGIQAKRHQGQGILVYNADEEKAMEGMHKKVEELKKKGLVKQYVNISNERDKFVGLVNQKMGGAAARGEVEVRMMYLLVGRKSLDAVKGKFKDEDRKEVIAIMRRMIADPSELMAETNWHH